MDFLTQYVQQAHPSPTQVAHHHKQPTSPGVASSSASDASSVFTTTTTDDTALASTAAAFGQLRTSEGVEGEQRIEAPSVKKGDWRTWGKVEARVLVWQDGALKKGKKASEQPKEEWVAEGTLWVTANRKIIFILDRTQSPRCVALEKVPGSPTRRLSLFGGNSASRKSFSGPSSSSPTEEYPTTDAPARVCDSPVAEEHDDGSGGAIKGLVKSVRKIFKKDDGEPESPIEGENRLSLTRTKTGERALSLEPTKSTSEPTLVSPFPSCRGHPITVLYVADPTSVLTVRSFSARPVSTPFWSPTSNAPLSSPTDLEDRPKPLGGSVFSADANTLPPCVELDIAPRSRKARRTGGGDECEQREVTIGFNFLETLLAKEAQDFHAHISSFLSSSEGEGTKA